MAKNKKTDKKSACSVTVYSNKELARIKRLIKESKKEEKRVFNTVEEMFASMEIDTEKLK